MKEYESARKAVKTIDLMLKVRFSEEDPSEMFPKGIFLRDLIKKLPECPSLPDLMEIYSVLLEVRKEINKWQAYDVAGMALF